MEVSVKLAEGFCIEGVCPGQPCDQLSDDRQQSCDCERNVARFLLVQFDSPVGVSDHRMANAGGANNPAGRGSIQLAGGNVSSPVTTRARPRGAKGVAALLACPRTTGGAGTRRAVQLPPRIPHPGTSSTASPGIRSDSNFPERGSLVSA